MLVPEGHRLFFSTEVVSAVSALEPQQLSCRDQKHHCHLRSLRRQGQGQHTITPIYLGAGLLPCLSHCSRALFLQTPGQMRPIRFLPGDLQITQTFSQDLSCC